MFDEEQNSDWQEQVQTLVRKMIGEHNAKLQSKYREAAERLGVGADGLSQKSKPLRRQFEVRGPLLKDPLTVAEFLK